jgi:hypothetical protein
MLTHYFSCSGGPRVVSTKSEPGYLTLKLCFASSEICGSRSASFMLRWDRYGSGKKGARTSYAELEFLQTVGYATHVVLSSASGV